MNRIFKVVWSKSRQAYIVVSEYAKSRGGKTKLVAAVLAFVMGLSAGTSAVSALTPDEQKIVDEVMKQVEDQYVKKGSGFGTAVDNDMVKPGENPVKANAEQYGAVAIGRNAHAVQYRTVAIGAGANAMIDGGIAVLGNALQSDGISFGRDSYARGIAGIAIGRDTQSGVNSITIGRMARAAYSRPGNIGNPGAKVTYLLGGDDPNNLVFNKNAVAIGTNSLAGASNIVFLTPKDENTYLDFASMANIWASRVYSRAQMTKIKDGTKKHISDRFYGEGDINAAAKGDGNFKLYDVVRDSGTDQVAVGHHSRALGDQAIAIGSNSIAGRYSIVMGGNTFGDGKQNDSFYAMYLTNDGIFRKLSGYRHVDNNPGNPNEGSTYAGEAGVAIGTKAHAFTQMGTAVGALARIEQDSFGAVALGAGASVGTQKAGHDSIGAVAIGMGSAAKGNGTVVLGTRASAWPAGGDVHRMTAVGYGTVANNADSVALGSLAEADRGSDMAGYFYGYNSATIDKSKEAGSIQLKLKDGAADLIENYEVKVTPSAWEVPTATETDIAKGIRTHVYQGLKGPALKANAGALSIGKKGSTPNAADAITRQIVNVAAGTNDTDAVNVAQLRNVNMMVEADAAATGTPKAFTDFLLDNARLKISGQSYLSTELTQDTEGPRITLKAKTTELVSNQDGTYTTKNNEDGLITAGELVKGMNEAKQARDKLEKKLSDLTYLNENGDPLVKGDDGKYYKPKADGTPDTKAGEQKPAGVRLGEKDKPMQLTNVAPATKEITTEGPTKGLADLASAKGDTVATVDDLKKLGFIIKGTDAAGKPVSGQVKHANTVEFAGEDLAKVITESANGVSKVTVKVNKEEIAKAVNAENAKKGSEPTTYVDKDGNPLVKDGDKYYKAKADGTPDTKAGSVDPAGVRLGEKDKQIQLTNVAPATKAIDKANDPTKGLADLANAKSGTVATVDDLKRVGFVVADGGNYHATVTNAQTVKFVGEGLAEVTGKTENDVRTFTVKVDDKKVADAVKGINDKAGNAPTQYVDKDGNPLVKAKDGKYYPKDKVGNDGQPTQGAQAVEPAGIQVGEKGKTTQLTNVAPATSAINKANDPTNGLADLANAKSGTVATVDDLKRVGFVVADGGNYHATVTNAQTVKFVGEGLAEVSGKTDGQKRVITVTVDDKKVADAVKSINDKAGNAPTQYVDKDGNPLVKAKDGKYYPKDKVGNDGQPTQGAQAVEPAGIQVGEKGKPAQLTNVKPGTNEITTDGPTKGLADLEHAVPGTVATVDDLQKLGFVIKGKAADGTTDVVAQVKHANTVEFAGEDLAKVITESKDGVSKVTVKVNKEDIAKAVNAENAKKGSAPTTYVDKDGNPLVKDGDKYYKAKADGTPDKDAGEQTPAGIQVGEKGKTTQLTNVAPATKAIDKANDPTNGLADLANAKDGTVATVADLKKLGFVVSAGDNYSEKVQHAQEVNFKGEGLAEVSGKTEGEKRIITVTVDDKKVADAVKSINDKAGNAPTQYVDKDGNPLVKAKDGNYYPKDKVGDDGQPKPDAKSVEPAGIQVGEKGKPTQLTNVKPGTNEITAEGPTKGLADLEHAVPGTVATVDDLQKLGFVIKGKAADGTTDVVAQVKHANTVEFAGEDLAKVVTESKDGVSKVTVKVSKEDIAKAVNAENAKKGSEPTTYVDKDGNPLVKGSDGKYYKPKADGTPDTDGGAVDPAGVRLGEKDKPIQLTNVAPATKAIDKANDPTNGLADLANAKDGTVATVADLKKLGFVVSAGDNYSEKVQHAQEVNFKGEGLAEVSGKTEGEKRIITVKVDDKKVADAVKSINDKAGNAPTQYVDKDGNPLVKAKDGNYYPKDKVGDDGQPTQGAQAVEPAGIQVGEKGKTTQLTNVAPATKAIDKENDPTNGLADLANAKSGTVATVDDLKRVGFVVADGANYHATVTNAQTVKFVGEGLAEVSGKTENNVRTFTVKVDDQKVADAVKSINDKAGNAPTQYVDKDGNPLVKAKDGNYYPKDKVGDDGQPTQGAQAVEPAGIQVGEKGKPTQLTNVAPATEAINKPNDPTNGLADLASAKDGTVATVADLKKLGFVIKGKATDGTTDVVAQVKHANTVEFAGEDLAKVVTESANGVSKVTVKVNKEDIVKVVNDANDKKGSAPTQYVDKDGNPLVKDGDKYYKQNPDGTPNTGEGEKTPAGIQVGEKDKPMQLDNVARGTESKPVNKEDGQPMMGTDHKPVQLVDLKDAKDTKVATVGDLKDMGFVLGASVNAAGGDKAYQDVMKNGNKVKFVGLGGAWVSGKTADDGTRIITIDVNADNLVTGTQNAIQYVDGQGNRMIPMLQKGKEVLYYNAADNPVKHKTPNGEDAVYKASDIIDEAGTLKAGAQPLQGKKVGEVPNLGVALVDPNGSADTKKGTVLRNVGEGTATIGASQNADDKVGKAKEGLADLDKSKDTNGFSVADAKKLGWVISTGKDGKDFAGKVQTADEVNFQGEENGPITVTGSANGSKRIVTIGIDAQKMAAVVKSELDKSGDSNVQYVDDKGNLLVKVGDKYYTKDQLKDDGQPKDGAKDSNPAAQKLAGAAPMQLKNVAPGTKSIEAPKEADAKPGDKAKAGLADLSVPTDADKDTDAKNTAATVDDLRRMGWVLSTGDDYAEKVQNADEINFKGVDGVTITGKTDGGKRIVSVGVDAQAVLEHADIPIVYKDKDNKPVTKIGNDFYTKPENANDAPVFVPGENGQKGAVYKKSDLGNDGKPKAGTKPLTPVDKGTMKASLNGDAPMVLSNVAAGNAPTDAVNKEQMDSAVAAMAKAVGNAQEEVRGVGADAAALAALKPLQYDPVEPTQIMAGIGNYQQKTAVALGVAHYTNESTMLNAGVSLGTGHTMVNVGYTRKFGHTKDEKEIPDRYKAGPISSIYVMQDEVSALKAENEQQKREIQELREMVLAMAANKK